MLLSALPSSGSARSESMAPSSGGSVRRSLLARSNRLSRSSHSWGRGEQREGGGGGGAVDPQRGVRFRGWGGVGGHAGAEGVAHSVPHADKARTRGTAELSCRPAAIVHGCAFSRPAAVRGLCAPPPHTHTPPPPFTAAVGYAEAGGRGLGGHGRGHGGGLLRGVERECDALRALGGGVLVRGGCCCLRQHTHNTRRSKCSRRCA